MTVARNEKATEIFKLTNLGHVIIRVEAHKSQGGMTHCFNYQRVVRVWAKCKQPPVLCGAREVISTETILKNPRKTHPPGAATVHWQRREKITLRTIVAAATQWRNPSAEELNEPLWRKLQLGKSSPPCTRPRYSFSQQQCAAIFLRIQLGDVNHSLSSLNRISGHSNLNSLNTHSRPNSPGRLGSLSRPSSPNWERWKESASRCQCV
jgi:hypothetical protein